MNTRHRKRIIIIAGLIASLGLLSITHGNERMIEIVGNDGRSFRAIPKSLNATVLVVVRESDKKEFSLAISTLTENTLERVRIAIKTQEEQKLLDQNADLEVTRKNLTAYSHRCDFGLLSLYSTVGQCATDKNSMNNGVTLKAPDRSYFHCYSLSRHNVSTKAQLREYASTRIEERMKGKTQPERDKLLKTIEVREVNVAGWSGFEVVPSELLHSIRSLFLERDGNFFAFNHCGGEAASVYHKNPAAISKLNIDKSEFERILATIKIE